MRMTRDILREVLNRDLMDVMIRLGLVALVVVLCVQVFAPFAGLMMWALILAVTLYPLYRMLLKRLGGRGGLTATVIVLAGLLLVGAPTVMLSSSFAGQLHDMYTALDNNEVRVPPPPPAVSEWPIVGEKVYSVWNSAATNLPALLEKMQPQLGNFLKSLVSLVASTAGGVLSFLGSLIIAGVMMAYGESGSAAMLRIISRLAGPVRGPKLHALSTATIRSVATGVVGVAFIQALLLGLGFLLAGIPAAGMLALLVMLLGIMQLPALIISLPAIGFLWWSGDGSTVMNIIFTVYLIAAGMADNVLKPILLGRGVDVPMPVILLGALGGMVSAGIVGLFVGAVLLAVGYQVFMEWVDDVPVGESESTGQAAPASE